MLLKGRYEVLESLTPTTRLARRLHSKERLIVKEIVVRDLDSWSVLQQLEEESRTLADIDHPAVPGFVDSFVLDEETPDPRCFLVREFVDGRPLDEELRTRKSTDDVYAIARELLGTLSELHQLSPPLIHGNLDLAKVLRKKDGTLAFIGFGLAAHPHEPRDEAPQAYQAPERGHEPATVASDLFSVGAIVLHLAGRREPGLLSYSKDGVPELEASFAPDLRRLLDGLLRLDPGERPPSAAKALALFDPREPTALALPVPTALALPRARAPKTTALATLGVLLELVLLFSSPTAAVLALPPLLIALYLTHRAEQSDRDDETQGKLQ